MIGPAQFLVCAPRSLHRITGDPVTVNHPTYARCFPRRHRLGETHSSPQKRALFARGLRAVRVSGCIPSYGEYTDGKRPAEAAAGGVAGSLMSSRSIMPRNTTAGRRDVLPWVASEKRIFVLGPYRYPQREPLGPRNSPCFMRPSHSPSFSSSLSTSTRRQDPLQAGKQTPDDRHGSSRTSTGPARISRSCGFGGDQRSVRRRAHSILFADPTRM